MCPKFDTFSVVLLSCQRSHKKPQIWLKPFPITIHYWFLSPSSSCCLPAISSNIVWLVSFLPCQGFQRAPWGSRLPSPDTNCISTQLYSAGPWYGQAVGYLKLQVVSAGCVNAHTHPISIDSQRKSVVIHWSCLEYWDPLQQITSEPDVYLNQCCNRTKLF